jgi:hypothetical protein
MNPRQGKVPYTLWLTKDEEKGLMEIIGNDSYLRRIGDFLNKLFRRGDFIKK